ncbi:MAG: ABC transporter ATP-binding protein/permease [Bacilli bacterium]|nr:ABC transporter ATP-binding protein/permease [Bacilli bacterium]
MLELRNLTKIYEVSDKQIVALKDITLTFGKSGFVVILGKSGSGKSTLLNLIGGLDEPTSGEIRFKGNSIKDFTANLWDEYRNTYVGFVFQDYNLLEEYTVKKNIALSLELIGYQKDQIEDKVKEILKIVDLEGLEKRKPKELSGGQRQRVALARALVKNPNIILCDEPTGNLDSATGKLILDTLKTLAKNHLVIMVTHDEEFAKSYGERIIELHDGVVVRDTTNNPEKNIIEVNDTVIIDISEEKTIPESVINYLNGRLVDAKEDLYLTIYRKDKLKNLIQLEQANYEVAHKPLEIINEPLALKKPKFHFNNWIKLAFHNLFTKKVKLALMLFLFTLSLTFVGVGLTLSLYDAQEAVYQTFQKGDITTIPFMKQIQECGDGLFSCYYNDIGMNMENIEQLRCAYPYVNFYLSELYSLTFDIESSDDNLFYRNSFTRISYLDDDKNLDYIGTFPQSKEQALITDYMALMMRHYGYIEVETDAEMIGALLPNGYEITGIVKTDYAKYYGEYNYLNINSDFELNYYEVYGQIFVNREKHDYVDLPDSFDTSFFYGKADTYDGPSSILTSTSFFANPSYIGALPQKENELMITYDYAYTELGFVGEDVSKLIGTNHTFSYMHYGFMNHNSQSYGYEPYEFTITGIITDESVDYRTFVLSDEMYKFIERRNNLTQGFALLGSNEKENRAFIYLLDDKEYRSKTAYSDELSQLPRVFMLFKVPLYILGGIFTIITGIIIYYFISASIDSKKKEIGILRALGTTGWDIGKIFITESMLIILFASTIANILASYFIKKIDTIITKGLQIRGLFYLNIKGFDLDIVFLYVNYLAIILVFIIGLLVVFLSVYVPIKRITKVKPIKVIKRIT